MNLNVKKDNNKLKLFIASSSREEIDSKYLNLAKDIANGLEATLLFGASSKGMMGRCYEVFRERKEDIYSYTISLYKDDLNNLEASKRSKICPNTFRRCETLYQDADIILILPGGTGTIAEFFAILEENRSVLIPKPVIVLNFEGYYDKLLEIIDFCIENNFNDKRIRDYFIVVKDKGEAIKVVKSYEKSFQKL